MSTFTIIPRKHMGTLKPIMRRTLKRIELRRNKLTEELQQLDLAEQAALVQTAEELQIDTDGPFRGIHVEDDGSVHALYCTCAKCQADLNNVSVTEAVEAMIERGFIHPERAAHERQQAAVIDRQRGSPMVH